MRSAWISDLSGHYGEQRAAREFRSGGFEVRRLDGLGDFLAISPWKRYLHVEVKNHKRLRLPAWLQQAKRETPPGFAPVVVFPDAYGALWACTPLTSLVEIAR